MHNWKGFNTSLIAMDTTMFFFSLTGYKALFYLPGPVDCQTGDHCDYYVSY